MSIAKNLAIALAVALLAIGARHVFPWLTDDNPLEETAEFAIKKSTGVELDLSPESDDGKK